MLCLCGPHAVTTVLEGVRPDPRGRGGAVGVGVGELVDLVERPAAARVLRLLGGDVLMAGAREGRLVGEHVDVTGEGVGLAGRQVLRVAGRERHLWLEGLERGQEGV